MLKHTFCHIQGIGPKTEMRLWEAGIHDWHSFLSRRTPYFRSGKDNAVAEEIEASMKALEARRADYFHGRLQSADQWRVFPDFEDGIAYIDIETTGLEQKNCIITTIALYDGANIRTYVNGDNLGCFIDDIFRYELLVTYNGRCFDVPFIESFFSVKLPHAHIDLRYVLSRLGFRGGLKRIERHLGISRNELEGIDGYFAVLLWWEYKNNNNPNALETLLAYNVEDVVNLEILMHYAYSRMVRTTPFAAESQMEAPSRPLVAYTPDMSLVEKMRRRW